MGILEDMERQRAQLNNAARANAQLKAAEEAQKQAQMQQEQAQQRANQSQGLGGILGGIASGFGEKIGDVGATLGNMFNTMVGGSMEWTHRDDMKRIQEEDSQRRNDIARKYGYNSYAEAQNDDNASQEMWDEMRQANERTQQDQQKSRDTYNNNFAVQAVKNTDLNKAKGQALSTIGTVLDFAPSGGIVGNVASGAVEGIADAYKRAEGQQEDAIDWGDALTRSGINAVSALGTGRLANKLGGGDTLMKSVRNSALTGAAGGAITGGLTDLAQTGDLGSALGAMAQGATSGAIGGGIMGGGMALGTKALDTASNKLSNRKAGNILADETPKTDASKLVDNATTEADTTAKALGWGDKDMTDSAKKRNAVQKVGDTLQDVGQATQDQSIIGKLKGNTADNVIRNNSIEKLRELGFEASDYEQAANLSTVANKAFSDAVNASDVKLDMPQVYEYAKEAARLMPEKERQAFIKDITERLDSVRVQGGGMNTFDAAGLEKIAKELGQDATKLEKTYFGGSRGANGQISGRDARMINALKEVKGALRNDVDGMVDFDANTMRAKLRDAGATDKQIEYLTQGGTLKDLKRNTSILEDAREMQVQLQSSKLKRSANSDNSMNIMNQAANAAGVSGLMNLALTPVGKAVGKMEKAVGKKISKAGDIIAGNSDSLQGISKLGAKASNFIQEATDGANTSWINNTNGDGLHFRAVKGGPIKQVTDFGRSVSANAGNNLNRAVQKQIAEEVGNATQRQNEDAQNLQDANALLDMTNSAQSQAQSAYDQAQLDLANEPVQRYLNQIEGQMSQIQSAMQLAMNAGDYKSYNELMGMYQDTAKLYEAQAQNLQGNGTSADGGKLTSSQQSTLTDLDTSENTLNQLRELYSKAGGAQGAIGGSINEFMNSITGGATNRDLATYNSLKESLGTAIVKNIVNLGGTEADTKRYLAMLPSASDTAEQAQEKFRILQDMIDNMRSSVRNNAN